MPETYTKEDLLALGVYELRSLAREIGVKAPTMLTKEEIANAVISVLRGEKKPERTTFGRPVKENSNIVQAINMLKDQQIPKEVLTTPKQMLNNYCSMFSNDMIIPTLAEIAFRGYVKFVNETTALIMAKGYCANDFSHNVIVNKEILQECPLRDGDLVECLAASIGEGKPRVATSIRAVNGLNPGELSALRDDFNKMISLYPNKKLILSKSFEEATNFKAHDLFLPIGFGSRVLITYPLGGAKVVSANQYLNAICKNNNIKMLVIAVGESPEDRQEILGNSASIEVVVDGIEDENLLELLDVKINHILRQVELGEDCVILITNFSKFKNYLKDALKLYTLNPQEANSVINKRLLSLLNLAKNSGDDGSLTIISLAQEGTVKPLEDMCLSSINSFIKYRSNYYENSLISLDLKGSYIIRKDLLYNGAEYLKCEKFLSEIDENNFIQKFKEFKK